MKIVSTPKYFDNSGNPYSVIGKECQCPECGTTFIPESLDDIHEVTYKQDSHIYCPHCGKLCSYFCGVDGDIYSGKL